MQQVTVVPPPPMNKWWWISFFILWAAAFIAGGVCLHYNLKGDTECYSYYLSAWCVDRSINYLWAWIALFAVGALFFLIAWILLIVYLVQRYRRARTVMITHDGANPPRVSQQAVVQQVFSVSPTTTGAPLETTSNSRAHVVLYPDAQYCGNCGVPVSSRFCPKCGVQCAS